jgi:hypothetical protein
MKLQTEVGEYEMEEVVRGFVLWRKLMEKNNNKRWERNQTEEGKLENRARSKAYYERNRAKVLQKRKEERERREKN